MKAKDMPCVTVEQVLRLREYAMGLEETIDSMKTKDLHTNNGDIREDYVYRMGWNDCVRALQERVKEIKT